MKNAALVVFSLALAAAVAFSVVTRRNLIETQRSLEAEHASHRTIVGDLEAALRDSDKSTDELSRELEQLQAEFKHSEDAEISAHGRVEALERGYQEQMEALRAEIESLKIQRDEMEAEIPAIRLEFRSHTERLEDSLRGAAEEAEMLKEALAHMERKAFEVESHAASEMASITDEGARLRIELEAANTRAVTLDREMESLRRQFDNRIVELTGDIELKDREIARLGEALFEMERGAGLLEDRLLSLTEAWEARLAGKKQEIARLSSVKSEKRKAETLIEELREIARDKTEQVDALGRDLLRLTAQAAAKEKSSRFLQEKLEKERAGAGMLADRGAILETDVARLGKAVEAAEEARRILEVQLRQSRERADKISENRDLLDARVTVLETELVKSERAFGALSEAMARDENRLTELKDELRDARARAEAMAVELQTARAGKEQLEVHVVEIREDFTRQIRELESAGAAKDERIAELNGKLLEAVGSLERLEAKIMDASSTMADLRHETLELSKKARQKEIEIENVTNTYENLVADLREELDSREVRIEQIKDMISIEVVDSILFPPGMAAITPDGERVLQKVGDVLKDIEDRMVRVVGHTDNIPIRAEYRTIYPTNWELSAARACSVARFFQHRTGLPPSRLEPVGRSFYSPVAGNDTEEGRALNRRVTITIGPRLDAP